MSETYKKPQSPLKYNDQYFYPLTTVDQIILDEDNARLNSLLESLVYTEEETGNIKTLFADKTKTETLFPRTKVEAISNSNNIGLDVLLNNKQEKHKSFSIILLASSWSSKKQTINAEYVTANNLIISTPAPGNHAAYGEAGVYCSSQAKGTLTFTCVDTPSVDLTVNILILD